MPVTDITKDLDALTMTVVADLDASVDRAWQLVADPRQLERWWGPPTYPATVGEHDLVPGGRVTYRMVGPEGDEHGGYWKVVSVDAPTRLEVLDGFAASDGTPNDQMPTMTMVMTFEPHDDGCRMQTVTTFSSSEQMQQMLEMGMDEGIRAAAGQIDGILASTPAS